MKIHMLLWDYWPGPEGGAERQCRALSQELVRRGHEITVLCAKGIEAAPFEDEGVKIERFGSTVPAMLKFLNTIEKVIPFTRIQNESFRNALRFWLGVPFNRMARGSFIREIQKRFESGGDLPEIVHVHETGWLAGVGSWIGEKSACPVVAKIRNTPAMELIGHDVPHRKRWQDLRLGCRWIALHEELKKEMIAHGINENRITVIPNAVDVPDAISKKTGDGSTVLCVGNLTQGAGHKGFDVLIQAWGKVHQELPDTKLVVLGRGDASFWKKKAEEVCCGESIRFPGFVSDPERYYKEAVVFVSASKREGMSNAFLEAQAYGLPGVVSDIQANRAVSPEGKSCEFFQSGDADGLARELISLLKDAGKRERMGKEAYFEMKSNFSRGAVTEKLLALYQCLVKHADEPS